MLLTRLWKPDKEGWKPGKEGPNNRESLQGLQGLFVRLTVFVRTAGGFVEARGFGANAEGFIADASSRLFKGCSKPGARSSKLRAGTKALLC
jgi:hypothetical protein